MAVAAGITVELPLRGAGFDSTLAVTLQTVNPNRVRIWQKGVTCPFEKAGIYKIEASENGADAKGLREDAFSFFQGRAINIAEDVFSPFYHRVASTARAVVPHWLLFAEMDPLGAITGRTFPASMPAQSVNANHWYDTQCW